MTTIEGAKKFDGRGKIEEPWDNEYANTNSVNYKRLKSRLETHFKGILEKKYEENLLDLEVKNFQEGSVIFDFTVFLTSTTNVNADSLKEAIEKDEGGSNFTISVESVKQVAGPTPTVTSQSPTTLSKGKIVNKQTIHTSFVENHSHLMFAARYSYNRSDV